MARLRTVVAHVLTLAVVVALLWGIVTAVRAGWRAGGEMGRSAPSDEQVAAAALLKTLSKDPDLQAVDVTVMAPNACYGKRFEPCVLVRTAHHGTVQLVGPDHRLVVVLPEDAIAEVDADSANAEDMDRGRRPDDGPRGRPGHPVLDVAPLPNLPQDAYLVQLAHSRVLFLPVSSPDTVVEASQPTTTPDASGTGASHAPVNPVLRGLWWFTVPAGLRVWGLAVMDRQPLPDSMKPYPVS